MNGRRNIFTDIAVTVVFFVFFMFTSCEAVSPKSALSQITWNAFTSCNFFRKNNKNVTYDLSALFVLLFLYPLLIVT